ncbi:MAG: hypothetical protein GY870_12560 [archaeon]|nr:hypothetical protein [archaeon]
MTKWKPKTFREKIIKKKEESFKIAKLMDEQLIIYDKIVKIIPDVSGTWNHGCIGNHEVFEKPIFSARSVGKNWDEISFGSLNCCGGDYDNPYFARAIKIVEGCRIRATHKVCIGRYDSWGDGYRPEKGWEEDIELYFGKKAIPIIQKFLDDNPFKPNDDEDDDY